MIPARFSDSKMLMMLMFQFRANIRIYSDIRIFVYEYLIFEYEYWKVDLLDIFVFEFGQKLSLVNISLRILGFLIRILEI